jgi:hypothetical protein
MTRRRLALSALALLTVFAANSIFSGPINDITFNYYSDSTYSNCVGWWEEYCGTNPDTDSWGTTTNYRDQTFMNCSTQNQTIACQQWSGSAWVTVECPQTYSIEGRLRVPVGHS